MLSDPPLLAVAWPPASHVAPDDYAEHLLPSDAQLERNRQEPPNQPAELHGVNKTK